MRSEFMAWQISSSARFETNCGARFGEVDVFELQHRPGDHAMFGGGHFGRQDLGEKAFNYVQNRQVRFAKTEKFPVVAPNDEQVFLLLFQGPSCTR